MRRTANPWLILRAVLDFRGLEEDPAAVDRRLAGKMARGGILGLALALAFVGNSFYG